MDLRTKYWFQTRLLRWFSKNRRDLPWRKTRDPYKILVSEIMLQQTQVERVIPKYKAFLREFPSVEALARAPTSAVIRAWSGLGYNRRAVYLKRTAEALTALSSRGAPSNGATWRSPSWTGLLRSPDRGRGARNDIKELVAGLEKLPGVGKYTARALSAFAFGKDVAAMDTNGSRVIQRWFHGMERRERKISDKKLWDEADALVPRGKGWTWNHAMMDFGALVCTKKRPKCAICPMKQQCKAYPAITQIPDSRFQIRAQPFAGSNRYWRGRIIELLRHATGHSMPAQQLLTLLGCPPVLLPVLVRSLVADHLVVLQNKKISLPR